MPASKTLVAFVPDPTIAGTRRRISIYATGFDVVTFSFNRQLEGREREPEFANPAWVNIDLGPTFDRAYVQRVFAVVRAAARVARGMRSIGVVDVVLARGLDNALLALFVAKGLRHNVSFVYEITDVQPIMWQGRMVSRALRWLERKVLRAACLVIVSSPGFRRKYLDSLQRWSGPTFVLENKVYPAHSLVPTVAEHSDDEPWVVGYFGALRCERSLRLLLDAAYELAGMVRVLVAGYPTFTTEEDLVRLIADHPFVIYRGRYNYPDDLSSLYGQVHFTWVADFSDEFGNSAALLPNRLYESTLMGVPVIAHIGTETARWCLESRAGCVIDAGSTASVTSFFRDLTSDDWQGMVERSLSLPRSLVSGESDAEQLVATLLELA